MGLGNLIIVVSIIGSGEKYHLDGCRYLTAVTRPSKTSSVLLRTAPRSGGVPVFSQHLAELPSRGSRRHRASGSKSVDPSKLCRNGNGPFFKIAKEYEHWNSIAGSLDHSNSVR